MSPMRQDKNPSMWRCPMPSGWAEPMQHLSSKNIQDKIMAIGLACDHGGFELKEELRVYLKSLGAEPIDMGTFTEDSVDYPDFGVLVAEKVSRGELERGILICGTGIGMSIIANKFPDRK